MYFGFQKVSIAYGKNTVLEDVSMEFQKGTITTIIWMILCRLFSAVSGLSTLRSSMLSLMM